MRHRPMIIDWTRTNIVGVEIGDMRFFENIEFNDWRIYTGPIMRVLIPFRNDNPIFPFFRYLKTSM